MINTIYYDIGAIVIMLFVMIAKGNFLNSSKLNKVFRTGMTLLMLACAATVIVRCGESEIIKISDTGLTILKTLYFYLYISYLFVQIITMSMRVKPVSDFHRLYPWIIEIMAGLSLSINFRIPFLFYYENHSLVRGRGYYNFYIVYSMLFIEIIAISIAYRKKLRKSVVFCSGMIVLLPMVCFLLQGVRSDINIICFGSGMSLLLYALSLGDDDYDELQKARTELEALKIEEKESREKADAAYRVKKRFMKKVSTDFIDPIEKLQIVSDELYNGTDDEQAREYAGQIKEAGNHLMEVVEQMINETKGDMEDEIC